MIFRAECCSLKIQKKLQGGSFDEDFWHEHRTHEKKHLGALEVKNVTKLKMAVD